METNIQTCMCGPRLIIISMNNKYMNKEIENKNCNKVNINYLVLPLLNYAHWQEKSISKSLDDDTKVHVKRGEVLNIFCTLF